MFRHRKLKLSEVRNALARFSCARGGNVGMLFALLVAPVVLSFGIATDYGNAYRMRSKLQYALDTAVLAGAQGTHLTNAERITLAKMTFKTNFVGDRMTARPTPTFTVDTNGRIKSTASTYVESSFMKVVHIDRTLISASSSATALNPQAVCLLALNKTMDKAINVTGTGSLEAVGCAVQANSTSPTAIYAGGNSSAEAAAFCTPGGYSGHNFTPTPKSCYTVEDPYQDMELPVAGHCDHRNTRIKKRGGKKILHPGTYCGGISIDSHAKVTFRAGVYIIKDGDFSVSAHSEAKGEDVTFYLTGNRTGVKVTSSSNVSLSAPKDGDYEGFLFIQDPDSNPGGVNSINGGGAINLVGTLYFPTQGVDIGGGGTLGVNSPMMPIIADHFNVRGNGLFQVDLDEANMDIELPMTNDGSVVMN